MYVTRLTLRNFRNYRELDLQPPRGRLLFVGDNAQGKSNLLEAVYLLATARSVRAAADGEMIGWEGEREPQPVARVTAAVERVAGAVQLEAVVVGPAASLSRQSARAGKRFRVNGVPRRAVDLIGNLRAVLFRAEDMEIVSGPPSERRRYMDLAVSQLDRRYYAAVQRYGRILQQRNAGLRRVKEGLGGLDEMVFWDASLVKEGALIIAYRLRHAARLSELASRAHSELAGEAGEALVARYQPRLETAGRDLSPDTPVEQVEAALRESLKALQRREIAAGLTLAGPHRDDLALELNGAPAASFGSRAQIRTATLALKLAEARLLADEAGDAPVLLLDDIVSELDEKRRRSVLGSLDDFDQVWLTATDTSTLSEAWLADTSVYRVVAGTVSGM